MRKRFRKFCANQDGASSIVEAAFVFPLIFLVLATLIFVGLYILQRSTMYTLAEKVAIYEAKVTAIPGYETLYTLDASSVDMKEKMSAGIATTNMEKKHDPYRYWSYKTEYGSMQGIVEDFVTKNSYIKIGQPNCVIASEGIPMFNQSIVVNITSTMTLPDFAMNFGLDKEWGFNVSARASVTDTSEFIRNTNMAFDLTDYLLEKFHVKDSVSKYMQRVKDIGTKWFGMSG